MRSRMVELYLNSHIRPRGVVLNLLSTEQHYLLQILEPEIYEFIRMGDVWRSA
jgi:hypothetical protein